MNLDNFEYISVNDQVTDFPQHYHDTFCISLIHSGVEVIEVDGKCIYSEKMCISITNPYEVHSNPVLDKNNTLSFDTIYVSPDLMKYICKGEETVGGYYGHNGHIPLAYVLPKSKIRTFFFIVNLDQYVDEQATQLPGRGVIPDYRVTQSYQDFITHKDNQLEFVLKLIDSQK